MRQDSADGEASLKKRSYLSEAGVAAVFALKIGDGKKGVRAEASVQESARLEGS